MKIILKGVNDGLYRYSEIKVSYNLANLDMLWVVIIWADQVQSRRRRNIAVLA